MHGCFWRRTSAATLRSGRSSGRSVLRRGGCAGRVSPPVSSALGHRHLLADPYGSRRAGGKLLTSILQAKGNTTGRLARCEVPKEPDQLLTRMLACICQMAKKCLISHTGCPLRVTLRLLSQIWSHDPDGSRQFLAARVESWVKSLAMTVEARCRRLCHEGGTAFRAPGAASPKPIRTRLIRTVYGVALHRLGLLTRRWLARQAAVRKSQILNVGKAKSVNGER